MQKMVIPSPLQNKRRLNHPPPIWPVSRWHQFNSIVLCWNINQSNRLRNIQFSFTRFLSKQTTIFKILVVIIDQQKGHGIHAVPVQNKTCHSVDMQMFGSGKVDGGSAWTGNGVEAELTGLRWLYVLIFIYLVYYM